MKLSRKSIEQGLSDLPLSAILGKQVSDALTPSQREFARKVAQGKRKVTAYKEAYPNATSPNTLSREPYMLSRDPRIIKEIEAYTLAIEAEKHRTPAALRSLVIQGLVQVALSEDTKDSVKVQALKTLGTVTEVAAFTERKEVRSITSSDDARARVMQELRGILTAQAQDATVIEADADSLLRELAGDNINAEPSVNINDGTGESEGAQGETPPYPDPPDAVSGVPLP
jgi:hypothetical protein